MSKLAERKNTDKLRWRNFPLFLMRPLAQVGMYGEGKYSMFNFLKGGEQHQYLDCIKRHLDAYEDPTQPDMDAESGASHLAHVAWNALVGLYMLEKHPELDDRYKTNVATVDEMHDHASPERKIIDSLPTDLRDFLIKEKVMNQYIKNCIEIPYEFKDASHICDAFFWSEAPEGYDFWLDLHGKFTR